MWVTVEGKILTTNNLQRWGIVIPWCSFCRTYGESIDHLFLHCWVARELWGFLSLLRGRIGDASKGGRVVVMLEWPYSQGHAAGVEFSSLVLNVDHLERGFRVFLKIKNLWFSFSSRSY